MRGNEGEDSQTKGALKNLARKIGGIQEREDAGALVCGKAVCVISLESSGMSRSLEARRINAPFPMILDLSPMKEVQLLREISSDAHLIALMVEPETEKDRNQIARVPWPEMTSAEKPNQMKRAGRLSNTLGRFRVMLKDFLSDAGIVAGVSLSASSLYSPQSDGGKLRGDEESCLMSEAHHVGTRLRREYWDWVCREGDRGHEEWRCQDRHPETNCEVG